MKQVYEIDDQGYLINIHAADPDDTDYIIVDPPNGLYRAKWTGSEWIEDMPQEDIDALNYAPPKPPTVEDRINMLEDTLLFVLGGGL